MLDTFKALPLQQAAKPAEAQKPAKTELFPKSQLRSYVSPNPNIPFKVDYPYLSWTPKDSSLFVMFAFNEPIPGRAPDTTRAQIFIGVVNLPQFHTLEEYINQSLQSQGQSNIL